MCRTCESPFACLRPHQAERRRWIAICESIVVVGAALSADVDAPTERVHSAPGPRRGQSPEQHRRSNRRANVLAVRTQRRFAAGATETAELVRFAEFPTNRA